MWPWLLRLFAKMLQKQFKFKIIEISKKKIFGDKNIKALQTTTCRYNFMIFYAFKMAAAIVFLCYNAVEAI